MSQLEAEKKDQGKPPMYLLPSAALFEIAKVLDFGATKYSAENWRKGLKWSQLYNAIFRHMFAHKDGEDLDSETKISHLAHAGCSILFLLEHELKKLGQDDRWKYSDRINTKSTIHNETVDTIPIMEIHGFVVGENIAARLDEHLPFFPAKITGFSLSGVYGMIIYIIDLQDNRKYEIHGMSNIKKT